MIRSFADLGSFLLLSIPLLEPNTHRFTAENVPFRTKEILDKCFLDSIALTTSWPVELPPSIFEDFRQVLARATETNRAHLPWRNENRLPFHSN
jgi:hypothetical protein